MLHKRDMQSSHMKALRTLNVKMAIIIFHLKIKGSKWRSNFCSVFVLFYAGFYGILSKASAAGLFLDGHTAAQLIYRYVQCCV